MSIKKPVKKFVCARDGNACRKCGKSDSIQLHHVLPQRLGGPDDSFNLISLCHECHSSWHTVEATLGISLMEKRVIEAFYLWLKGEPNKAKGFMTNVRLYRELVKAKAVARKKGKRKRK